MANVKFYRLGLNGGVSNASYLEYTNITDGRIVFAQVKSENASDPLEHYIWANGIEYHVADASELLKIEHTLNVLLDGAPIDTSIGKMIQDALDGYELTAENFVKLVDSSNSNVKVSILDSSLVLEANSATTDDVISTKTVGYVTSGMTIPEGTTLQQLVDMIFTKIRGLEGATAPSVSLNGVPGNTHEIGETINVTLSSAYTDGSWTNEERWGAGKQSYQSSASSYIFKLDNVETSDGVYNNYVVKASNNARVDVNHTGSTVIPKNEAGTDLIKGSTNDTEHYIEFKSTDSVYKTASFNGYFRYWIGNSTISPDNINRDSINSADFNKVCQDLAKSNTITCDNECIAAQGEYMYIIVPSEYTLTKVQGDPMEITASFSNKKGVTNIGLKNDKKYTIYYNYNLSAVDGVKAVSITITKNNG